MLKRFGNKLINTDRISEVEELPASSKGKSRLRFRLDDAQTFIEEGWSLDRFEECGASIIVAPANFNVIEAVAPREDEREWIYLIDPILAFSVPWDGAPLVPIMLDGAKREGGYWAVRHPSGRCERPFLHDFSSEAEWKVWVIKEHAADQKREVEI